MIEETKSVPPKRGRGRPATIDRQQALDAAVKVFWEKGYEGASLDDLTAAMKMSRPALYNAFGDKQALFGRVLDRYGTTFGSAPLEAFEAADAIEQGVDAFLRTSLMNNTREDCPPGCLYASAAVASTEVIDDAKERLNQASVYAHQHLTTAFEKAMSAGTISSNPSAGARANLLLDLMNAQAFRARSGVDRATLLAELPSRVDAVLRTGTME